jgi:quercetin dioxygenase-like cupin family protein
MPEQTYMETHRQPWQPFDLVPGTYVVPLANPLPQGSIHKLKMVAGTMIPAHKHPSDEYVYVLSGTVQTGDLSFEAGTFWFTPANTKNGPHYAVTDVEVVVVRLGAMGDFEII